MIHHLVVDEITRRHGPVDPSQTTVRVDGDSTPFTKAVLRFYAFYQFCALGSQILPSAPLADLGYNAFIAIQSSAFLMTLFRKGLIRYYTHAVVYTTALVMSLYYMTAACPGIFWFKICCVFGMRVKLRMDKYLIWFIYCMFSIPECENKFINVFALLLNNQGHKIGWSTFSGFSSPDWKQLNLTADTVVAATAQKLQELEGTGNKAVFGLFLLMAGFCVHIL